MKNIEQITNVPPEVFRDLPFATEWKSELIEAGGNVQRNFVSGTEGVVHVSPLTLRLSEDEALLCRRWIDKDKARVLAENQSLARDWSLEKGVKLAEVRVIGNVAHKERVYMFWYESFVEGKPLNEAVFDGFEYEGYVEVVEWLSGFHELFPETGVLVNHYRQRLSALDRLFAKGERLPMVCTETETRLIRRLIEDNLENLEATVEPEEKLGVIHGDFRGGNILVSGGNCFGVIDFEQGIFGGDWFCDLVKLLEYFKDKPPDPSKPSFYRPPLTQDQKTALTRQYIASRRVNSWKVPRFVSQYAESGDLGYLRRRQDLLNFDTIMSVIILRQAMGWDFYQKDLGGREARGVRYLLEKLRKDHGEF